MGLMTVLKKMKQKEKEMRILILYPFLKVLLKLFILTIFVSVIELTKFTNLSNILITI